MIGREHNMAHFSEIRTDNNEVIRTVVINDNDIAPFGEDSPEAEQWVSENIKRDGWLYDNVFDGNYPETYWKRTSYNTRHNQHLNGGTPFRGNGAGPGYTYDSVNDVFWPPKPHASWVKDNSIFDWAPPIAYPNATQEIDGTSFNIMYRWNEEDQKWEGHTSEIDSGGTNRPVEWDVNTSTWSLV